VVPHTSPGPAALRDEKPCCAEMMTQRPSPAGDEGNLVGGVTRPRPKASFASPFTKPAFWLNDCWTHQPGRAGTPTPAHAVFAAASSCLSREERLAVLVNDTGARGGRWATVWVLVHARGPVSGPPARRVRNLTGAMLHEAGTVQVSRTGTMHRADRPETRSRVMARQSLRGAVLTTRVAHRSTCRRGTLPPSHWLSVSDNEIRHRRIVV